MLAFDPNIFAALNPRIVKANVDILFFFFFSLAFPGNCQTVLTNHDDCVI